MFIVNQMRSAVINVDNIIDIYQEHNKVLVGTTTDQELVIGKYKTDERAWEVLAEILNEALLAPSKIKQNEHTDYFTYEVQEHSITYVSAGKVVNTALVGGTIIMPEE